MKNHHLWNKEQQARSVKQHGMQRNDVLQPPPSAAYSATHSSLTQHTPDGGVPRSLSSASSGTSPALTCSQQREAHRVRYAAAHSTSAAGKVANRAPHCSARTANRALRLAWCNGSTDSVPRNHPQAHRNPGILKTCPSKHPETTMPTNLSENLIQACACHSLLEVIQQSVVHRPAGSHPNMHRLEDS